MKAITAKPETIREVFSKKYIIPDFQRPYSWEKDNCDRLWQDLIDFLGSKEGKADQYFLGNIVVNPTNDPPYDDYDFSVIDGQQRLTTLLLLIKVLALRAGTFKALEECLRDKNPLTSELTTKLRIKSCVLDADRENLEHIILQGGESIPKCKLHDNYLFFKEKMEEWCRDNPTSKDLEELILALLDNVVMLPIHCDSEDDALTIFETINNRGLSLADADIFKAKLYKNTDKDRQDGFKEDWDNLKDHNWLFRILTHVLRAEAGDQGKEIGMRSYLVEKNNPFGNPDKVMNSLKTIHAINSWDSSDEIACLWGIMRDLPNYYWNCPLYVFLHKHGKIDEEATKDAFVLPEEKTKQFMELLEATAKYFFIKGIVHNTVSAVKDTVFRVCVNIEKDGNYLSDYSNSLKSGEYEEFSLRLEKHQYRGGRYVRGLVLLSAYLNPKQNKTDFNDLINGKCDVEHILPRAWNHYDGWTSESHTEQLNTLGNLVPLSKSLNIAAKNEFFAKKKIVYAKSKVQDALDLLNLPEWTPEELNKKSKEKLQRLLKWLFPEM